MENKEIIENNKILAEFIGYTVTEFSWNNSKPILVECEEDGNFSITDDIIYFNPESDWNILMRIVNLLKELKFEFTIDKDNLVYFRKLNPKIYIIHEQDNNLQIAIYKAVVSIVKDIINKL